MDELTVLMKTEAGSEEMRNRTYGLSQKVRSLLIMIDGKKPVGAYIEIAGGLGDVPAMLYELETLGLIEKRAVAPIIAPAEKNPAQNDGDEKAKKAEDVIIGDGRGYLNI